MKPNHEVQYTARERHRRDRRARHQADKALTATIAALGAGETEDWPQDTTEHHKPARREQRGAEG